MGNSIAYECQKGRYSTTRGRFFEYSSPKGEKAARVQVETMYDEVDYPLGTMSNTFLRHKCT